MTLRRPSRSPLPAKAVAALGAGVLALGGLAACSSLSIGSDDSDGESSSAAPSSQAAASGSNEVTAGDPAAREALNAKALSGDEVPGVALQEVPAEQLAKGASATSDLVNQANFTADPPECSMIFEALQAATPESAANAVARQGTAEDTPNVAYIVYLNDPTQRTIDPKDTFEKCGHATVTMDVPAQQGGEPTKAVYDMTNEVLDTPAPEGVENFVAGRSNSDAQIAGQQVTTGTVQVSGTINGVEIVVNASSAQGSVPPEAEQRAIDMFARQVEKVRNS